MIPTEPVFIPEFFSRYAIYKTGYIFSFYNIKKPRRMKTTVTPGGYEKIGLRDGTGKQKTYLVHRLVAESFMGKIPRSMEVNHIDCNKRNNTIYNLEIVTKKQNAKHAKENGRYTYAHRKRQQTIRRNGTKRSSLGAAKLSEEDVKQIKNMIRFSFSTQTAIAYIYNVSVSAVNKIANNKTWTKEYK